MASLNILIGGEIFRTLREEKHCYVDKTGFIEEFLSSNRAQVSLITRPRRFGKTLTMTTLGEFFDISKNSRQLFDGLAISQNKKLCDEWMNRYPTVFLSLKNIEGANYDSMIRQYQMLFSGVLKSVGYLFDSPKVDSTDKVKLSALRKEEADDALTANSLFVLTRALEAHWQKPAILLIDEYDAPINYAEQNGYYRQMIGFMRSLLGSALKTNTSLKLAVLTGCLRVAKESIFSGLNNFMCYSVSDADFADKFGFTESELDALLATAGLTAKKAEFKEWYDGYLFGTGTEIYCPWDVLAHLARLQKNADAVPQAYWNNTSGNAIVKTLISGASENAREKIETLVAGGCVEEELVEDLTYDVVYENENSLWTMLFLTGYLTKARTQPGDGKTALVIPNKEVRQIFTKTAANWFDESVKRQDFRAFTQALWNADAEVVQKTLTGILYDSISYYDGAENYYHGFMTGLLRGAGLNVASNREKGTGRPDIVVEDGRRNRAIIVELKRASEYDELESKAEEGLKQIEDRNYAAGLQPQRRRVVKYGVAFWKKETCVRVSESER